MTSGVDTAPATPAMAGPIISGEMNLEIQGIDFYSGDRKMAQGGGVQFEIQDPWLQA